MTENERKILEVLRKILEVLYEESRKGFYPTADRPRRWMTPTQIGMACGIKDGRRSSWACRYLKRLRDRGFVRREPPGVYAITEAGLAALEES